MPAASSAPPRVAPMLATLVDAPFHRPGWVWEEKYDGIRLIARKHGRRVELITRNDKDRTGGFPDVAAAVAVAELSLRPQREDFHQLGPSLRQPPIGAGVSVRQVTHEMAHRRDRGPEPGALGVRALEVTLRRGHLAP